jgi:MFS family permease
MEQGGNSRGLYYGWVVVAVTALVLIVSAGVRSAPGVFLVPMLPDFGDDRAAISLAASIGILLFGLAGPLAGILMDRYGPKRTILFGMTLVGAGMLLSARMQSVWELHLFWGVVSGLGTGMASAVLGAAVATRWFVARRGLVTGLFGAATSAGQLIFVLLLAWLAQEIGWRTSTLALGGVALALLVPTLLLMRDDPSDLGLRPYGAPADAPAAARPTSERGVMGRALRSWTFWLLAITFFVCGATSNGLIGVHFIPHAVDHGIGQVVAAGTLSIMGMFNFVGTIGSGWLTDRYDPRKLLALYYGFRGLSLFLLPFTTNQYGLIVFAVLFGLDYIATVPPTTALVADTFGRRNVGTVFGWVFCAHQVGAALAAWLGGLARESLGSYALAFIAAGVIALAAAGLSLRIERRHGAIQPAVEPAASAQ